LAILPEELHTGERGGGLKTALGLLAQLQSAVQPQVDKAIHVGYSSEVLSYQRFVGKPGDGKRRG
jgi:hypothetical protein